MKADFNHSPTTLYVAILCPMEMLLTVEQAAARLQLAPFTVRQQLKRGALRGIKRGRVWRIPESALMEPSASLRPAQEWKEAANELAPVYEASIANGGELTAISQENTPEARAKAILAALRSGDKARRNAAIIRLAKSDEQTVEIVTEAAARAVEEWNGPDDDFADWRALDGEPFHFPEEAPDYLNGLYRADKAEKEDV